MYSVNYWGSHPEAGNDDCWTGKDFATLDEAVACYLATPAYDPHPLHDASYTALDSSTAYVELCVTGDWTPADGPEVYEVRANPGHKPDKGDDDWRREMAMEAGMLHGVEAYNDVMGWS